MTANDLSQVVPGNWIIAPSSSRRWQRIRFNSQQRTCWSLWERFSVRTTPTAPDSRVAYHPLISRACWRGRTCMSMRACASVWPTAHIGIHTRANKNTCKHTNTHRGATHRGPSSLRVVPVDGDSGHAAARSAGWERDGKRGEMQRGRDDREDWTERIKLDTITVLAKKKNRKRKLYAAKWGGFNHRAAFLLNLINF